MKWTEMLEAPVESLREHYAGCRNLAYNGMKMAQHGRHTQRKLARNMGYLMRQIDMMENAARKRGISLV